MQDINQMPFTLDEAQINNAVARAISKDALKLDYAYTVKRTPPVGLNGNISINEPFIKAAVADHVRQLVNPAIFKHFQIEFSATRGESGITASIIASSHPFDQDNAPVEVKEEPKVAPRISLRGLKKTEPVEQITEEVIEEDTASPEDAPFETDEDTETVTETVEGEEEATATEEAEGEVNPRPALFASLRRPAN